MKKLRVFVLVAIVYILGLTTYHLWVIFPRHTTQPPKNDSTKTVTNQDSLLKKKMPVGAWEEYKKIKKLFKDLIIVDNSKTDSIKEKVLLHFFEVSKKVIKVKFNGIVDSSTSSLDGALDLWAGYPENVKRININSLILVSKSDNEIDTVLVYKSDSLSVTNKDSTIFNNKKLYIQHVEIEAKNK